MTLDRIDIEHYSNIGGIDWPWIHFPPEEMADMETGHIVLVPMFMDWLETVRAGCEFPLPVNDATRSEERQMRHSGRRLGSHVVGLAADIRVHGYKAHKLEKIAHAHDVLGIGHYQNLAEPISKRFIHVDVWYDAPDGVRPNSWSR